MNNIKYFLLILLFHSSYLAYAQDFSEIKKLLSSDAAADDAFGFSVVIDGDIAIVGARLNDDSGNASGSAYVLYRDQGGIDNWGEVKKIVGSDLSTSDWFGHSVSLSGNTAVISAPLHDDIGNETGSVYIFDRHQGGTNNWGEVKRITASDGQVTDRFGISVSISSDVIIVGADFQDNGNIDPNYNNGAAYIFSKNYGGANNWGEVKKLFSNGSDIVDFFGYSVSISNDNAIVGSFRNDDLGSNTGTAYVYSKDQGGTDNWGLVKNIYASDAGANYQFGVSVSIDNDIAVIGAFEANQTGAAYIFSKNQGGNNNWGQEQKILASDAGVLDRFGNSVSVDGETIIVGGFENDDNGTGSGSAYIYSNEYCTSDPLSVNPEIHLENGDIFLEGSCTGVILTSPNGGCYKIVVDNSGNLLTQVVTCPN